MFDDVGEILQGSEMGVDKVKDCRSFGTGLEDFGIVYIRMRTRLTATRNGSERNVKSGDPWLVCQDRLQQQKFI